MSNKKTDKSRTHKPTLDDHQPNFEAGQKAQQSSEIRKKADKS